MTKSYFKLFKDRAEARIFGYMYSTKYENITDVNYSTYKVYHSEDKKFHTYYGVELKYIPYKSTQ